MIVKKTTTSLTGFKLIALRTVRPRIENFTRKLYGGSNKLVTKVKTTSFNKVRNMKGQSRNLSQTKGSSPLTINLWFLHPWSTPVTITPQQRDKGYCSITLLWTPARSTIGYLFPTSFPMSYPSNFPSYFIVNWPLRTPKRHIVCIQWIELCPSFCP